MHRRSFLGSLAALCAAPLALFSKKKPADPDLSEYQPRGRPSEFTYNGVEFKWVESREVQQEHRCTGSNPLKFATTTRFRIGGMVKLKPGQTAEDLSKILLEQNKRLSYRFRGSDLIGGEEVEAMTASHSSLIWTDCVMIQWTGALTTYS